MVSFGVGQSKVKTWRQCRRQYHYKYVEELQRKRVKRPFMFGKIIHRMLEEHGQKNDPMKVLNEISFENEKLFTSEKEMYGEIVEDIRIIMTEYFAYWDPLDIRFIPVIDENDERRYTEHEFAIPLNLLTEGSASYSISDGDIIFKGQVDSLVKTPNDLRWLGENKSFDKLPDDDERWRNLQTIVYRRAVLALGWMKRVDGVFWNYIMSKAPTRPKPLQNGDISSRDIVTLPSAVTKFLQENGMNEKTEKARKLMEAAEGCRSRYFQRIFTPVSTVVADNIFSGFVDSAREMRDNHGHKKDQNIGRHCGWCDYEPLCRAELTGGDVEFLEEREYTHEDPEAYRRSSRGNTGGSPPDGGPASEATGGKRSPKLRVLRTK